MSDTLTYKEIAARHAWQNLDGKPCSRRTVRRALMRFKINPVRVFNRAPLFKIADIERVERLKEAEAAVALGFVQPSARILTLPEIKRHARKGKAKR